MSLLLCFYCILTTLPKLDFHCFHHAILLLLLKLEVKFPFGDPLQGLIKNLSSRRQVYGSTEAKATTANQELGTGVRRFRGIPKLDVWLPTWNTFCSLSLIGCTSVQLCLRSTEAVLSPVAGTAHSHEMPSELFLNCVFFFPGHVHLLLFVLFFFF